MPCPKEKALEMRRSKVSTWETISLLFVMSHMQFEAQEILRGDSKLPTYLEYHFCHLKGLQTFCNCCNFVHDMNVLYDNIGNIYTI